MGANSVLSAAVHRQHRVQGSGRVTKVWHNIQVHVLHNHPSDKRRLGKTGYALADVVEIGGQQEYRFLYHFLGSLFRIHTIVVRLPIKESEPSIEQQLKELLQILFCNYKRVSGLECPAILVAVNGSAKQVVNNHTFCVKVTRNLYKENLGCRLLF